MKNISRLILCLVLILGMAGSAECFMIVENGGFEEGSLDLWNVAGRADRAQALQSKAAHDGTLYTPVEGDYLAALTGRSTITQDVSWEKNDVLKFSWAFLAMDRRGGKKRAPDSALFLIKNDAGEVLYRDKLASVASTGNYGDTGWQEYAYVLPESGSGKIIFRSVNSKFKKEKSILLLDNIYDPPATFPVPEPSTLLLVMPGLAGLAGWRKRRLPSWGRGH